LWCGCLGVLASIASNPALAADLAPVQPIYVAGSHGEGYLGPRARFEASCRALRLPAPLTVTLVPQPEPRAVSSLREGHQHMDRLDFEGALRAFDLAATDAGLTGADGLDTSELADIYLFRALARQKLGGAQSTRVWADLLRAASIAPDRVLDEGRFPPSVIETWRRALGETRRRPRGTVVVRAPAGARISLDAHPAVNAPGVFPGVPYGEHHLRVEEPGRVPWATVVAVADARTELDVPERAVLNLADGVAAAHGQRAGARFVMTAYPHHGEPVLDLRLIEVKTGLKIDGAIVLLGPEGALESAMATLQQVARERVAPSPPRIVEAAMPAPPARPQRTFTWVTWVALGVAAVLGGALALQLSSGRDQPEGGGFSATVDTSRLGK